MHFEVEDLINGQNKMAALLAERTVELVSYFQIWRKKKRKGRRRLRRKDTLKITKIRQRTAEERLRWMGTGCTGSKIPTERCKTKRKKNDKTSYYTSSNLTRI